MKVNYKVPKGAQPVKIKKLTGERQRKIIRREIQAYFDERNTTMCQLDDVVQKFFSSLDNLKSL
jgi:hypothetical protein